VVIHWLSNSQKQMKAPKLDLSIPEKTSLKNTGVKTADLSNYAVDELCEVLHVTELRAKEILATIEFQGIPSVGPKFARDLINMGYYTIPQLKYKDGAALLNDHERFIGTRTDPCVEDQFRLIVYHANNPGSTKQWWDFTTERKAYRASHGYPDNRPV
jgi:hypothetical protein